MEAYAAVPPDDPFAASKGMFTMLAADLAGPAAAGLTACELEDLLDERGREVLRQLLQDHLDLRVIISHAASATIFAHPVLMIIGHGIGPAQTRKWSGRPVTWSRGRRSLQAS